MKLNIALLAGDGIGPEVIDQAVKVSNAVAKKFNHQINWVKALTGAAAIDAVGDPYPEETHQICLNADAILFGAIGDPRFDNDPSAKVRPEQGLLKMRKKLGLFANVRPTFVFPSLLNKSPLKKDIIDLENKNEFLKSKYSPSNQLVLNLRKIFKRLNTKSQCFLLEMPLIKKI